MEPQKPIVQDVTAVVKDIKSGYKTTEFWMTVLSVVVSLLMTSSNNEVAKVAGTAGVVLSALGYTVSRSSVKKG